VVDALVFISQCLLQFLVFISQRLLHFLKREVRLDTIEKGKAQRNETGVTQRPVFVGGD
jgi:hypothetical protein